MDDNNNDALKKLEAGREEFYRQPEVLDKVLRHVHGDDYLQNWRPESDRVQ